MTGPTEGARRVFDCVLVNLRSIQFFGSFGSMLTALSQLPLRQNYKLQTEGLLIQFLYSLELLLNLKPSYIIILEILRQIFCLLQGQ